MPDPAYPAARALAATVEAHFAQRFAASAVGEAAPLPLPDAAAIEAIIDASFWASLRREEGRAPRISLALLPPECAGRPLRFAHPLPLTPGALTKLAPAVERPGIHLGVWREQGELCVWGATRGIPPHCFVLQVIEPGLLVVKHRRAEEFGKFANVVVLQGDQVKLVDEDGGSLADCPALVRALLGFGTPDAGRGTVDVLVQLAVSMRAHGHGGTLLVVPADGEAWRESIVHPIPYAVMPAFSGLAERLAQSHAGSPPAPWPDALQRAVDAVAGLTAVDGATVMNERFELLAFGAKIGRRRERTAVEQMVVTEPVVGSQPVRVHPTLVGGTRHLSAAQFVHDQPEALALVASQDGRFTVFAWSPCAEVVHAHRVDALLL